MDTGTLLSLRNLLAVPAVIIYCMVGYVVGQRDVSRDAKAANRAFQVWWYGLAGLTVFTPLLYFMDQAGITTLSIYLVMLEFLLLLIVVAIGCLVYYLLYVYFGRNWIFWPVAVYHVLLMTWLFYIITAAHPTAYGKGCPNFGVCWEHDFTGGAASTWLGISLVLPIVLATLAYFALFFRVETRMQRYRIAMVAGALLVWFGLSLVSSIVKGDYVNLDGVVRHGALSTWNYWTIISNVVSLVASFTIYLAYRPPDALRARLGGESGG